MNRVECNLVRMLSAVRKFSPCFFSFISEFEHDFSLVLGASLSFSFIMQSSIHFQVLNINSIRYLHDIHITYDAWRDLNVATRGRDKPTTSGIQNGSPLVN